MGRNSVRAVAVSATVVLLCGSASAAVGAPADTSVAPVPLESPTGSYIVLLDEEPAATYEGDRRDFASTKPEDGEQLDPRSSSVREYAAFLEERQLAVAADAGVDPAATYQITLNGFSAKMSPETAAQLAAHAGVRAVHPDEIFRPDAVPTTDFLGLEGAGGAWEAVGGTEAAGSGVVIGVIDTGIAPENPSFKGARLRGVDRGEPYIAGDEIVFEKADGLQFRSTRVTGDAWPRSAYSTKLVAAQHFSAGAENAGFAFDHDVLSPRDSDGHGSHTAGTAAGVSGVAASVDGVDLGVISGVAPAAKIAAYKACYVGGDPLGTADDVCVGSDLLAAVEQAVTDGVDVISYSIGRGAAASEWAADDLAFYNAAVAGVFIAVSAGNSGPGASTLDRRAAPWYTTVAASTVPTFEGTAQLSTGFQAAGASVSVPAGASVTAPAVYAGNVGLPGAAGADLCYLGTLDPAKVTGKIVVCDRGTNPRGEKSQEVADAGGVGMILVNVTPDSLDNDLHAVPTVHIDAAHRAALLGGLANGADATLVGANVTGFPIPAPQIAGFSSRGPTLAGDSDILTPDLAAPGVAIAAATQSDADGEPTWGVRSGTSMAAPHVAGLAALSLGMSPASTPDEIKSALMTTTYPTVNADGSAHIDPFAQGAGHINPRRFLDPGLVYVSAGEWAGFAAAQGLIDADADEVDGRDLNLASIAVGALAHTESVTRTLTATRPGTYTVGASMPGMEVTVEPSTLTFEGPGDRHDFTVSFTNATAPVDVWAFGRLTWTGEDGTSVQSPLAVRPVSAGPPDSVAVAGIEGSTRVSALAGVTGDIDVNVSGLAPVTRLVDPDNVVEGHSGNADSGDANGDVAWVVEIPTGSPLAQFSLSSSEGGGDLDLTAYRIVGPTDTRYVERWVSRAAGADEQITIDAPTAGHYLVVANVSRADGEMTWDLTTAVVTPRAVALEVSPGTVAGVAGRDAWFMLAWKGLDPDTRYLGVLTYGDSAVRTIVEVDAGAAPPVAEDVPSVTGDAEVGAMLRVDQGVWSPEDVSVAYQWLRDGEPIPGAVDDEYRIRDADVGTAVSAEVIATQRGNVNSGRALSDEVIVNAGASVAVTIDRYRGTTDQQYAVTVDVTTTSDGEPANGSVSVWVDATQYDGTLAGGRVTFALPAQSRGIHVVVAEYAGSVGVDGATGVSGFIVD